MARPNNINPYSSGAAITRMSSMLRLSMKFDVNRFKRELALYAALKGKSLAEMVRWQANLFCKDMLALSPPYSGSEGPKAPGANDRRYGIDGKARKQGENAVNRDVRKIFAPIEQAQAGQVARYGNFQIFDRWINKKAKLPGPHYPKKVFNLFNHQGMVTEQDYESFKRTQKKTYDKANFVLDTNRSHIQSIHERMRGPANSKKYYIGKNNIKSNGIYYVDNMNVVTSYIKQVQARVGKLKSGWYFAGKELGAMPNTWISQITDGKNRKIFVNKLELENPSVKIGCKYMGTVIPASYSYLAMAKAHRSYALRNNIAFSIKYPGQKKNLKGVINYLKTTKPKLIDK